MELADARFSGYQPKPPLNHGLTVPDLVCVLSSSLQIVSCYKFSETSETCICAVYRGHTHLGVKDHGLGSRVRVEGWGQRLGSVLHCKLPKCYCHGSCTRIGKF